MVELKENQLIIREDDGSEVIYEGDTDLHTYLSVEMNGENSVKFKIPPYQLDMIDPVIEVFLK